MPDSVIYINFSLFFVFRFQFVIGFSGTLIFVVIIESIFRT